jgi:AcrR family transcriptional regulator
MPTVRGPPSRRRGGVTVDDVVAAAIDIVDREGVDALTIRRVAEACGLSPMGLYRHVRDKDDLLDRVVNAVVGPGLQDLQAEGGFTGTDAVHAFDTLLMFMFGSVLWEIPRTTDTRERLVAVAIGDEAATQIIERATELSQRDPTEYFEAGLNTILDGLRASRRR